jgi:TonB family protein
MSGSTAGGTFSAPAGNTLYGEMPKSAPNPEEVTPYQSEHYVPPTQVTVLPRVRCGRLPRSEYPEEARLAEIEGRVVLKLLVDETGRIAEATVVEEPGHGLGAATVATLKRHCRADAARRGNTKVATEVRYTFRWELE